jgi:acyl-CoA dehydrogenase
MDMRFTEEQQVFRAAIRDFVTREVSRDRVRAADQAARPPLDLYRQVGVAGWLTVGLTELHGGSGTFVDVAILLEELARGSYALASLVSRTIAYANPLLAEHGTSDQRDRYLPLLTSGEFLLSVAMTEPDTGSDAAAITTRAEAVGDELIVTGRKIYSSGAVVADRLLVSVRTDPATVGRDGISLVLVDPRARGVELTPIGFMGNRANPVAEIAFDSVRVPLTDLVGSLGGGWSILTSHLERERISMAAKCVGAMQAVMRDATDWANTRVQFGRPLSKLPVIRHKLADMTSDIYLARLATYHAAGRYTAGDACRLEAFIAKVTATEAYQRTADHALQIMGAFGYSTAADVERHFRDSRSGRIGGGTSEILRTAIGAMAAERQWDQPWW